MKIKILGGLVVAMLAIASVAEAQTRTPVVNHRQRVQRERINDGVRHGELNRREASHLRRSEHRLRRAEFNARRDGYVSARERRHLNRRADRLNRQIYRDKHNRRY